MQLNKNTCDVYPKMYGNFTIGVEMSNFNKLISPLQFTSVTTKSVLIFIPNTEVPWPMLQSSMPAYLNIHICSV